MMRDECWNDIASLDAEKITNIQTSSGDQYLRSDRNLVTAHETRKLPAAATL
jgi:hypothetical protein